jgi:ABC-2 type transport system ATP-binding protein
VESDRDASPRKRPSGRTVAARPGSARGAGTTSTRPPDLVTAPAAEATKPSTDVAVKAPKLTKVVRRPARATPQPVAAPDAALSVRGLTKQFGGVTAVDSVDLEITAGTFYGFVGPNGAGKTTTLAMITGLLRPDAGVVRIHGADVWRNAGVAKRSLGVLPDNLRLFDRLTGAEFLHHAGALRGLDHDTTARRIDDLVEGFGLRHSLDRFVSDYSAGMVKKIAIAAAMIHSPRLLVLDEPFESVDPVSANAVIGILKKYAAAGGTVLLSSHSMGLIERTCDAVAIIANGRMLAAGPLAEVLDGESLETRFVDLAGGAGAVEGMEWLQSYSD